MHSAEIQGTPQGQVEIVPAAVQGLLWAPGLWGEWVKPQRTPKRELSGVSPARASSSQNFAGFQVRES